MTPLDQGNLGKTISVVFSFRNEEEALPELIKRTRQVLTGEKEKKTIRDYEMIFVNDDSTDQSLRILKNEVERHLDIRVITMSRRFGVSHGVLAGMERARGDAVVYLDADLQDPPEVISQLIAEWQKGDDVDVVHTVRISRAGESLLKILMTKIGYGLLGRVMDFHLPFEAGDFKLISRRALGHLLQFKEKNPFLRAAVCWIGFRQAFVYYQRQPRRHGRTKFPVLSRGVVMNFLDSALISFSSVPLRAPLFIGLGSLLIGLVLCVYFTVHGWRTPSFSPEGALIIVLLFILSGLIFVVLGMMGLYLNSIFQECKGRPNYIVKETLGFPADQV